MEKNGIKKTYLVFYLRYFDVTVWPKIALSRGEAQDNYYHATAPGEVSLETAGKCETPRVQVCLKFKLSSLTLSSAKIVRWLDFFSWFVASAQSFNINSAFKQLNR